MDDGREVTGFRRRPDDPSALRCGFGRMPNHEFKIEELALEILNAGVSNSPPWAVESARRVLDQCMHDGTPIVVIDARGRELGRVVRKDGDRYVWTVSASRDA